MTHSLHSLKTMDLTLNEQIKIKKISKVSVYAAGLGFLLSYAWPFLVSLLFSTQMVVREGNGYFKSWEVVPLTITNRMHIFHITNPEQFASGQEKAKLKEMGPYVWNQNRWKEVISWSPDKQSVKYWDLNSFVFDASQSVGSLSDKVTVINAPIYSMAYVVKTMVDALPMSLAIAPVVFSAVNALFLPLGEKLMKELTVGELVNGYPFSVLNTIDTLTKPLQMFGMTLPDTGMPGNKYGLFSMKNHTRNGPFEVYTGQGASRIKFLRVKSYKEKKYLTWYSDPKCNMLNGTDGSSFGSYVGKDDTLYMFLPDACRSLPLNYQQLTSYKLIPTYRFTWPDNVFAGPHRNPANKCYCRTKDHNKCDGIMDIGRCNNEAPMALSFPHFLTGSSFLLNGVKNLSPDKDKHQGYFDIEPITGSPIHVCVRIQANLLMKPIPLAVGFGDVSEAVVPYFWIESEVGIDSSTARMLKVAIYPLRLIDLLIFFATWIGFISFIGAFLYKHQKKRMIRTAFYIRDTSVKTQNAMIDQIENIRNKIKNDGIGPTVKGLVLSVVKRNKTVNVKGDKKVEGNATDEAEEKITIEPNETNKEKVENTEVNQSEAIEATKENIQKEMEGKETVISVDNELNKEEQKKRKRKERIVSDKGKGVKENVEQESEQEYMMIERNDDNSKITTPSVNNEMIEKENIQEASGKRPEASSVTILTLDGTQSESEEEQTSGENLSVKEKMNIIQEEAEENVKEINEGNRESVRKEEKLSLKPAESIEIQQRYPALFMIGQQVEVETNASEINADIAMKVEIGAQISSPHGSPPQTSKAMDDVVPQVGSSTQEN